MRPLPAVHVMRKRAVWLLALCVVVLVAACQSAAPRETRRLDRSVITREQMLNGNYSNVFDAVAALHSSWLRPRTATQLASSVVWVYVDGSRAGDVEVLRTIQPTLVNAVRFYDGPTATSRWGVDHASGVIHVSTWSSGAGGITPPDSTRPVRAERRDSSRVP